MIFKSHPAKISAIEAYMAATILQPKWDLCTLFIIEQREGIRYGVSNNKPSLKISYQYSYNKYHSVNLFAINRK
jgi:hypothetical protein